jgi:RNA polymerase sigma factor (sigma-70 family)
MEDQNDAQLLRAYAERRSEPAIGELVRRHVDFVYSAARRIVRDPHLAEDVTQGVFVALANNAGRLVDRAVLSGWLHRAAQNIAAQTVRTIERRRARESRYIETAMNELLSSESEASWEHIAPHLDAAIGELSEPDRDALFLRYFQRKSAREIASTLSISDEAAQKRVQRAVDRLRDIFARRGLTVGASGFVVLLAANAVEAAPVGLAVTISAAAVAGTGLAATATATATKVIAMTTLQKTVVGAALVAAVGTGVYETRQASTYRTQAETLEQQQAPLAEQVRQLQQERDDATNKLVALQEQVERLDRDTAALVKLRAETARLRASNESAPGGTTLPITSPGEKRVEDVSQVTQEGWQLLQTGRLAEAITRFESAVKADPGNSAAWNGLGWARFNSGKPNEAEKAFQRTIEIEPDHAAALNGLGQLYLSQKEYASAESYLLKAGPKAPAAWYGLAKLYLLQNKFDQAEQWAQTIVDAGQADETVRAMLKAAKDKNLNDALRLMIEPQTSK